MTKAKIKKTAGFLLSLYIVLLEASELIRLQINKMYIWVDDPPTQEEKIYYNKIKNGMDAVRQGAEYFEVYMMKHGRTKNGIIVPSELHEALMGDANDFARFCIDLYNARVNDIDKQEEMENLLQQYVGEPTIPNNIRELFKLKEYDS